MKGIVIPKGTKFELYSEDESCADGRLLAKRIIPLKQILVVSDDSIEVSDMRYKVCYWKCTLVDMDSMEQVREVLGGWPKEYKAEYIPKQT